MRGKPPLPLTPCRISLKYGIEHSANLPSVYPSLGEYLDDYECSSSPTCVSLGPNGTYFIREGAWYRFSLPDHIKNSVDNWEQIKYLWLGKDGSFLMVKYDERLKWDFRGHYSSLDKKLSRSDSPPLV